MQRPQRRIRRQRRRDGSPASQYRLSMKRAYASAEPQINAATLATARSSTQPHDRCSNRAAQQRLQRTQASLPSCTGSVGEDDGRPGDPAISPASQGLDRGLASRPSGGLPRSAVEVLALWSPFLRRASMINYRRQCTKSGTRVSSSDLATDDGVGRLRSTSGGERTIIGVCTLASRRPLRKAAPPLRSVAASTSRRSKPARSAVACTSVRAVDPTAGMRPARRSVRTSGVSSHRPARTPRC
jgi:hypothetical protein